MTQLTLFDEAVRHDLERARYEIAWLTERLEAAKVEYRKLRDQQQALRRDCQALEQTVEDLRRQVTTTTAERDSARRIAEMWRTVAQAVQQDGFQVGHPPPPGLGREALTTLLTLAHPDKWSQGQPATELAHELSVVINRLRTGAEA
jgi:septal ring factor EnvC (AmiA/AmiB activator)